MLQSPLNGILFCRGGGCTENCAPQGSHRAVTFRKDPLQALCLPYQAALRSRGCRDSRAPAPLQGLKTRPGECISFDEAGLWLVRLMP